jgi:hypothetical protein
LTPGLPLFHRGRSPLSTRVSALSEVLPNSAVRLLSHGVALAKQRWSAVLKPIGRRRMSSALSPGTRVCAPVGRSAAEEPVDAMVRSADHLSSLRACPEPTHYIGSVEPRDTQCGFFATITRE